MALRIGPRRIGRQLALVGALIAVSPAWNVLVLSQGWDAVAQKALPAYLGSFGMGMLVAVWGQWRQVSAAPPRALAPWTTAALLAGATLVVVGDAVWQENGWWLRDGIFRERFLRPRVQSEMVGHLGAAAGFALLVAAAAWGSGPAVRWLGWRPLAALGTISYGLYLWHLPLLLVMRHAGLLPDAVAPRFAVVLAVSVVAAAASWRYVERPWMERRTVAVGAAERPAATRGSPVARARARAPRRPIARPTRRRPVRPSRS